MEAQRPSCFTSASVVSLGAAVARVDLAEPPSGEVGELFMAQERRVSGPRAPHQPPNDSLMIWNPSALLPQRKRHGMPVSPESREDPVNCSGGGRRVSRRFHFHVRHSDKNRLENKPTKGV